ncbi:MAG: hypothetical protein ACRDHW_15185, partial [Ktedonobacteraceae bacterium]
MALLSACVLKTTRQLFVQAEEEVSGAQPVQFEYKMKALLLSMESDGKSDFTHRKNRKNRFHLFFR